MSATGIDHTKCEQLIERLRERIAELEAQRSDAFAEYTRCAGTPLMADVLKQRDRALSELAEARELIGNLLRQTIWCHDLVHKPPCNPEICFVQSFIDDARAASDSQEQHG